MKEEGWVLNLNQLQHFIEVISKSILKDGKSFQIMEICDSNKNMLWWIVMIILSFLTRWSLSIGSSVWDLPVWLIRQESLLQGSYQYLFTMLSVTHKSMAVCKTAVSPLQGSTLRHARVPRACRSCPRAHKLLWLCARLGKWFFSLGMYLFFQQYT